MGEKEIEPNQVSEAISAAAKLEVLQAMLAVAKKKKVPKKIDHSDAQLQAYRQAANQPLKESNREAHLFNIDETISQLTAQVEAVMISHHPQKAQLIVQLEYALERAESTKGHLIQMARDLSHQKPAQEGLDFLKNFHLETQTQV